MGHLYSSLFISQQPIKLCDDCVPGDTFMASITIHSDGKMPPADALSKVAEYLNHTRPVATYAFCKTIHLLYNNSIKYPLLRSNVTGEMISGIASDVVRFCIKNEICDPYYVEVVLTAIPFSEGLEQIKSQFEQNNQLGYYVKHF